MVHPRPAAAAAPAPAAQRAAAFFDLDKTVIATTASTIFARDLYRAGLVSAPDGLRAAWAHATFLLGPADEQRTERLRAQMSAVVAGWKVEALRTAVAGAVGHRLGPAVHEQAVQLIAAHHAAGRDVLLVSASAVELVEPIAAALGADGFVATQMEVADGRYTGRVARYVHGPEKAVALAELARTRRYDLAASHAYSDSVTDLPMLEAVGHPAVVNPDAALRALAVGRGWEVLTFGRRSRTVSALTSPVARATAGAVAVAGTGALVRRLVRGPR